VESGVLGKAPYVYSGVGEEVGVKTLVGRSRRPTRWHILRCPSTSGCGGRTSSRALVPCGNGTEHSAGARSPYVPTFITVGGHDEVRPSYAEIMLPGIRNSELLVFEDRSHSGHLEELDRHLTALPGCLARVDAPKAA